MDNKTKEYLNSAQELLIEACRNALAATAILELVSLRGPLSIEVGHTLDVDDAKEIAGSISDDCKLAVDRIERAFK